MSTKQPIRSNIPQVNVLVGGKWKVRAMVNSGATTTMISSGLLALLEGLDAKLHPTSFSYFGVGPEKK